MTDKLDSVTSKELMERFSTNTRYLCKQKGKSIGELEKEIGVSTGYISRLAKTKQAIKLSSAYVTAKILEVSMDDLLSEDLMIVNRIHELEEELNKLKMKRGEK